MPYDSYPFWEKNRADRASADAGNARSEKNKAKNEKEKLQKTTSKFVYEIESLLDDFKDDDTNDLITKLKESIKKFKESC